MFELILTIALLILPACATEDSDNCAWSADTHGNGRGLSFITIDGTTFSEDGSVTHYGN